MAMTLWHRAAVLGLFAGLCMSSATFAQGVPAETPPLSYSGDQYVDSRGCVFVRVGFGTATEWVPRVGRDRQQVCGMAPSGGGFRAAPDFASTSGVTVIGGPAPAPAVPAPVIAAAPAAPQIRVAPQVRVVTAPAPVTVQAPSGISGCPNLPAAQQPYFTGEGARCGPQVNHPGVGPQSGLAGGTYGGGTVTGVPRSFALSAPPAGYQLAWDDGRLNPYRGVGTPSGEAQMLQVWTNTVPRRLTTVPISAAANRPQISYARNGGNTLVVASSSRAPLANGGDVREARARVPAVDQPASPAAAPAAAPANEVRVGAGHRHVLAGTFAGQAEAANAYNRLASVGLPARIGQVQRQGQTLFVVMAGPYGDPQTLGRALLQARGAGFPGAITRN